MGLLSYNEIGLVHKKENRAVSRRRRGIQKEYCTGSDKERAALVGSDRTVK